MLCDVGTEVALLAAVLQDRDRFAEAAFVVTGDDFSDVGLSLIWQAVEGLVASGKKPDRTLARGIAQSNAKTAGLADDAIDKRLARINNTTTVVAHTADYAATVKRMAELRRLEEAVDFLKSGITPQASPDAIGAQAIERLLKATLNGPASQATKSYVELQTEYQESLLEEISERANGRSLGLMFDFPPWDDYTLGMRPADGDLAILGGDPGSGKTVTIMHMLRRFALAERQLPDPRGALFVSLEMGPESTAMRWSQMMSRLRARDLRGDQLDASKVQKLQADLRGESDLPLYANFSSGLYADQLKAMIAAEVHRHNVKVVAIDHLRYIRLRNESRDPLERDEARIRYIREEICKALGVACIVLAHTRKGRENSDSKKPSMADLMGSQMIAAQLDALAFMFRPWTTATDEEKMQGVYDPKEAYLVWAKNRVSGLTDARFDFDGSIMEITDAVSHGLPPRATIQAPPPPRGPEQYQMASGDEW